MGRPDAGPRSATLFLSSTAIGETAAYRSGAGCDRAGRRYNGTVSTAGGEGSEEPRSRPTFLTLQAKAVLVVWLAVTLVLVVVYVIVLLLV
jgi:hypothetical protein